MRKVVGLVISAVIALLVGCQRGDNLGAADESAPSAPAAVGQPITVEQRGKTATVTILTAEWKTGPPEGAAAGTAPSSGAYLVLDVEWSGEGSYNPLYLEFKNDKAEVSTAIGGAFSGYEPAMQSGKLAGDTVRGFVVFDTPKRPGRVTLSDALLQHVGSWTIPA